MASSLVPEISTEQGIDLIDANMTDEVILEQTTPIPSQTRSNHSILGHATKQARRPDDIIRAKKEEVIGNFLVGSDKMIYYIPDSDDQTRKLMSYRLIIPIETAIDEEGDVYINLFWIDGNKKHHEWFSRKNILDPTSLKDLHNRLPLSPSSIGRLAEWFYTCLEVLDIKTTNWLTRIGWHSQDSKLLFNYGGIIIGDDSFSSNKLYFRDDKQGGDSCGSIKKYAEIMPIIAQHPVISFTFFIAASAPVINLLKLNSFLLSLVGVTSSGKTTTLKIAKSIWGNPQRLETWYATNNAIESKLIESGCLPYCIDDTKMNPNDSDKIKKLIYMISSNSGKARSSSTGVRSKRSDINTIMISTGENPIRNSNAISGLDARMLEITEMPFSRVSEEVAQDIKRINSIINRNYGVMGPLIIQSIIDLGIDHLKELYEEGLEIFLEGMPSGIHYRIVELITVGYLGGKILQSVFPFFTDEYIIGYCKAVLSENIKKIDDYNNAHHINQNAVFTLITHIMNNASDIDNNQNNQEDNDPLIIKKTEKATYIDRNELSKTLCQAELSIDDCESILKKSGALIYYKDEKRLSHKIRREGKNYYCYAISNSRFMDLFKSNIKTSPQEGDDAIINP